MSEEIKECPHLGQIKVLRPVPAEVKGCDDCLKSGDSWVQLRVCKTCGYIGCCDKSKNKHMTKHSKEASHPIVQSIHEDATWMWCNVCQAGWEMEYFTM